MEIISHRGYWKTDEEKNVEIAFERSFSQGFGTETDIRDFNEKLVISHDIATRENIKTYTFLEIYKKYSCKGILALNIKADGLHVQLKKLLDQFEISNYFVFDMSIPDTLGYVKNGLKFFSRQSEYEMIPSFYEQCDGIWLDGFNGTWFGPQLIKDHLKQGKKVALVSPELHKRNYTPFWDLLKREQLHKVDNIILCTDLPEEAKLYFL